MTRTSSYKNMENKFTGKPMWKIILKMSLPSFIIMLFMGAYTFTDVILSVKFGKDKYSSAEMTQRIMNDHYLSGILGTEMNYGAIVRTLMNTIGPIVLIINSMSFLFTSGLAARVGVNVGKGNIERAKMTARTALMGGIFFFAILIPVVLSIVNPWLTKQTSALTAELASPYAYIIIGTYHISFIINILIVLIRTEGKNKALMIIQILPISFNLGADILFMGVFKMGVEGGAFATVLAQLITLVMVLYILKKQKSDILNFRNLFNFKVKWITLIGVLLIGVSPFLRNFGNAIVMGIANNQSKDVSLKLTGLPGYLMSIGGSINPIYQLAFPAMFGVVLGAIPVVSFHYGAKNFKKVKEAFYWTIAFSFAIGLAVYLFFAFVIYHPLLYLMNAQKGTKEYSDMIIGIRLMMISIPIYSISIAGIVLFSSTARILQNIAASIVPSFLLMIPSIYLFSWVTEATKNVNLYWLYNPTAMLGGCIFIVSQAFLALRNLDKERISVETIIQKANMAIIDRTLRKYNKLDVQTNIDKQTKVIKNLNKIKNDVSVESIEFAQISNLIVKWQSFEENKKQ